MGDYTGLRFRAVVNEMGHAAAAILTDRSLHDAPGTVNGPYDAWALVAELIPGMKLDTWLKVDRRSFIPCGAVCYMPDDWVHTNELVDGEWRVSCSLKDYEGEIEVFLKNVLPQMIARPCAYEKLFEYDMDAKTGVVEPIFTDPPYDDKPPKPPPVYHEFARIMKLELD